MALACVGSLLVGYSSVSLMDNIVCMACTLSFPTESAAVVGLLKVGVIWGCHPVQLDTSRGRETNSLFVEK
eukprot:1149938-Amphidinium_carterae.1